MLGLFRGLAVPSMLVVLLSRVCSLLFPLEYLRAALVLIYNEILVLRILLRNELCQLLKSLLLVSDLVLKPLLVSADWFIVIARLDGDRAFHFFHFLTVFFLVFVALLSLAALFKILLLS